MLTKCRVNSLNRSRSSRKAQNGITVTEYAVGAALIAAAVLVSFGALGNQIGVFVNTINAAIG